MSFQSLAPELVHQIYNSLSTISDVVNLSLTCQRFNSLLRNAHKLTTLFAVADRDFGPITDIKMLVTYSHTLPAHAKRDPALSYALLRQSISVGVLGKQFEALYPSIRWNDDYINRRMLTSNEARRVRKALYRYWLYSEAFHNRLHPRTHRLLGSAIEERSQLLRSWSTSDLIDIEDVRKTMEDILTFQICPSDGTVQRRIGSESMFIKLNFPRLAQPQLVSRPEYMHSLFHGTHDEVDADMKLPTVQARYTKMDGWGDDIAQYHQVQSLLKLNPAQILWLHDHAIYKWQVEALIHELGGDWFWNNGQTFSDTWMLVLNSRGEDIAELHDAIVERRAGIAVNGNEAGAPCETDELEL